MKQFLVFKIAKFEFKVTVHYGLWAKCTQLRPLNPLHTGATAYKWIFSSFYLFMYVLLKFKFSLLYLDIQHDKFIEMITNKPSIKGLGSWFWSLGAFYEGSQVILRSNKNKNLQASSFVISVCIRIFRTHRKRAFSLRGIIRVNYARCRLVYEANL